MTQDGERGGDGRRDQGGEEGRAQTDRQQQGGCHGGGGAGSPAASRRPSGDPHEAVQRHAG